MIVLMTQSHHYEMENETVKLKVYNKKGKEFTALFDLEDLDKVQAIDTWVAQWSKEFNTYIVQTTIEVIKMGKNVILSQPFNLLY